MNNKKKGNILLSMLFFMFCVEGCNKKYNEPKTRQEAQSFLGVWELAAAPKIITDLMSQNGVKHSSIELRPHGDAVLTSVGIETDITQNESRPKFEWSIYSGNGKWSFEDLPHQDGSTSWTIVVYAPEHSSMRMSVKEDNSGVIVLIYQNDPELKSPTVYKRMNVLANQ